MLRFLDAGESHGKAIIAILDGLPYGIPVDKQRIEQELSRRRLGYGRSARMELEDDDVQIMSGVRAGITVGGPVAIQVENDEHEKWAEVMKVEGKGNYEKLSRLRPGHADLSGAIKYGTSDVRNILERASARETVGRVCIGAIIKSFLAILDIEVYSHVLSIGSIHAKADGKSLSIAGLRRVDMNPLRCLDEEASEQMMKEVDEARARGDSLGGIFEVVSFGLPIGLGSHVHWDRKLDARLAMSIMSIQAIKGVEIGDGFMLANKRGSEVADVIYHEKGKGFMHRSNHAGGLEGGMTNGEPLVVRAAMKPIPTLASPLDSVDLVNKKRVKAAVERADVCAVPAAAVIAESAAALVLADALLEKTGGDSMDEIRKRFEAMLRFQVEF